MSNLDTIKFYKTNDKYGCFSNFSMHSVNYEGFWKTAEHCFQAMKFAGNDFIINGEKIYNCETAFEAAKLGRSLSPLVDNWEEVKDVYMFEIVKAKFTQHSDIRKILLSTYGRKIVEHTTNDSYWGDGGNGKGQNKLGIILMKVRDILSEENYLDKPPPWEVLQSYDPLEIGLNMGEDDDFLSSWVLWFRGLDVNKQQQYKNKFKPPVNWSNFYQ